MHDPVIGLDEERKIIFANSEAVKISGLKTEELIGKNAREISIHNDLIRSLLQEINNGKIYRARLKRSLWKFMLMEKKVILKKKFSTSLLFPTGEQTAQLIGHVIILRNVTLYKELDFAKQISFRLFHWTQNSYIIYKKWVYSF